LKSELHRVCGVDLTKIPGIKEQAAQIIISEVGLDMTRWNTEKLDSVSKAAVHRRLDYKGMAEYEIRFRLQRLKWLKHEAKSLDMQLLPA
jgi:ribosomal protein S13